MSESLTNKTANGVVWSVIDAAANSGITFLVGIILARMLTPEEYGLIGIIAIFIALFQSVVDSGLTTAIIRDKKAGQLDFSTAFYSNVVLGILMSFLLFTLAPLIASFFKREELLWLTRAMSAVLLINSFSAVQRALLVRAIDFKSQALVSVIASITSGVVGIVMAYYGMGVWSLVGQQLSRYLLQSIMLWVLSKWRPSLQFSAVSFKRMFKFGWKIMVSGIIGSIWNESYQIVIGKFYTPASLGQYTRAKQFSDIFSTHITSIMQRVTFPALSTIQDESERLRESFRRLIKLLMLVTSLLLLGVAASSEALIFSIIGPQWDVAVKYLPILCLQVLFYPVSSLSLNILMVKGRSDLYLFLEIIKRVVAIIPLIVGIFVGIYAMLWSSVLYGFFAFLLNTGFSGRQINYSIKDLFYDIIPTLVMGGVVAGCVYLVGKVDVGYVTKLLLQILTGTLSSIVVIRLFYYKEVCPYIEMAKDFIKRRILTSNKHDGER